jgi:hypothetical protein
MFGVTAPAAFAEISAIVFGLLYHVCSVMAQALSIRGPYSFRLKVTSVLLMTHEELQCRATPPAGPSYTLRQRVPFSPPSTIRKATAEV